MKFMNPRDIARKKDNSIEMCMYYRKLNQRTFHTHELNNPWLSFMHLHVLFSTVGLATGFSPDSHACRHLLNTTNRLSEFRRMPFGLVSVLQFFKLWNWCSGSSVTQYLKNITGLTGWYCGILSDHWISSTNFEFEKFREYGIKLTQWNANFRIGNRKEGISVSQDKSKVVKNSRFLQHVRNFLHLSCFTSYYSRFVSKYAHVVKLLDRLIATFNMNMNKSPEV